MSTPSERQDAKLMASEGPLGLCCLSKIPDVYRRVLITRGGGDQAGGHIRVPAHGTDGFPTNVGNGQHVFLVLGLCVPDDNSASSRSSGEDVGRLMVPVEAFDVISPCHVCAESGWLTWNLQIGEVKLALYASSRDYVVVGAIEAYGFDGTGVTCGLGNQRLIRGLC